MAGKRQQKSGVVSAYQVWLAATLAALILIPILRSHFAKQETDPVDGKVFERAGATPRPDREASVNQTTSSAAPLPKSSNAIIPADDGQGPRPDLAKFLRQEAKQMDLLQSHPERALERISFQAEHLNDRDRAYLAATVLSERSSINERQLALHVLKLDSASSADALETIALAPLPRSTQYGDLTESSMRRVQALALNIGAMEALEGAALRDRRFTENIKRVRAGATDRVVSEVALLSLQEVSKGRSFFASYFAHLAKRGSQ